MPRKLVEIDVHSSVPSFSRSNKREDSEALGSSLRGAREHLLPWEVPGSWGSSDAAPSWKGFLLFPCGSVIVKGAVNTCFPAANPAVLLHALT